MKKSVILSLIGLLCLAFFIFPVSAFSLTEVPSYSPSILYNNTEVTANMGIMYNCEEETTYSCLVYKTELQDAVWVFTITYNNDEKTSKILTKTGSSGSIPWFDIYQPHAYSRIDIKLKGTVIDYYGYKSVQLFKIYDTVDMKTPIHQYDSDNIPIYEPSEMAELKDVSLLKEQLAIQEERVSELSQYTDTTELNKMITNFKTAMIPYDVNGGMVTTQEYANLVANMDNIIKSVINFQSPIVEQNLKSIAGIVQDSAYYDEYKTMYKKWQANDYSDQLVSKSYAIVYYVQQDLANKENMKTLAIVGVIFLIVVVIGFFFMIRKRNRERMEEF